MLDNLLNSKLKRRLLQIFFALPQRSFTMTELKAASGGGKPYLEKALREFVRSQVVLAQGKGPKRYYKVNTHFRLFGELEDLLSDRGERPEDPVAKILKRISNAKLIIMTGIFTFQPQLPIDLLFVGSDISRPRLEKILAEIASLVGEEVNYTLLDPEEFGYRRMMSDRFIRDVFDYPHLIIHNTLR